MVFYPADHQVPMVSNNVLGVKPDPAGVCLWSIIGIIVYIVHISQTLNSTQNITYSTKCIIKMEVSTTPQEQTYFLTNG